METETPEAGEPPLAEICGLQFGLMTTTVMLKLSVMDPSLSLTKPRELTSARWGLPAAPGQCTTCTATSADKCQGHFAHIMLPTPIFHPNHVERVVRLLRKICLNCGKPKKKSLGKTRLEDSIEQIQGKGKKAGSSRKGNTYSEEPSGNNGTSRHKRKLSTLLDEEAEASEVLVLSSDEEELSSNGKKQQETPDFLVGDDFLGGKASTSSARRSRNGKRKSRADSSETSLTITPTVVDLTDMLVCVKKPKKFKGLKSRSGVEVVDDTFCSSPKDDNFTSEQICLYCSASSQADRYPQIQLKVEVKEGGRSDMLNLAKSIRMEIKDKDYKNVAPNYWSFVGGNSSFSNQRVPKTRNLLPSEALKIIRKIPYDALLRLGMQPDLAPPEALIVECLPVPPNCTRLQEDALGAGGTNIGFKLGFDRATQAFTKLLNKINSIKASRFGRPSFHAAGVEASSLQALFGQYLREKGAPKAVPGKEKKRTDHVGRVQKRASRWSLDWLKRNVLGKRSGFCARNVVTGDPFLTIEEIGVPLEVAKYLTYPVRVTRLNQSKLQECVEIGQELGMTRACGAVRIVKNGEKLEITPKSAHQLEIGDVVHRHLSDGDLVYVNRPPSLHKHSLIALKTHIQDSATFAINPAVCAPLHADFDGDCLHVFVPQSEEAKAEIYQLLSVPEQILPSPEGKTIIGLSQDNILGSHLVTSSPVFVGKELMHQLAMWSSWELPTPTILKAPRGGPLWTGKQIVDLTIPDEFSFRNDDGTIIIQGGELLSYGGEANWLASTSGLVKIIARRNPAIAVKHLDCSQAILREWLLSHGFSVSLKDFYASPDSGVRRMMKAHILRGLEEAQCMATDKQYIFDRKLQKIKATQSGKNVTSDTLRGRRGEDTGDATAKAANYSTDDALEDVAVTHFLESFSEIGEQIGEAIDSDNSLLAMVRSGSKGSMAKAFQQIGCLGLQLYKGEHLVAHNNKLSAVARATDNEEKWEARGLVRSSLLDGLEPMEFFLHAIAVRAGLLRQSLEVTEPGELFKRLMLFLRDIHVSYDGTVRNKCGLEIIQFCYEGVKLPKSNDGVSMEWNEAVTPGEAVGILAATAIAQPAYQVMLEANHNVGSKKIRPLELLQETMFPRSTSSLKASDRRSILRLSTCNCGKLYCDERRILQIQSELQPITVQSMTISTAIEYIPDASEEWDAFYVNGERHKLRMPWIGHILLDQVAMIERGLCKEKFLKALKMKIDSHGKALRKFQLGVPLLCLRDECSCTGVSVEKRQYGPCLHFSPMPKSDVKRRKVKISKDDTMEILSILQDFLIPLIMNTTVKGDDRIESTRVVWEDVAWSPPGRSIKNHLPEELACSGELVLEVTVKEKFSTRRGVPWMVTAQACLPVEEAIDWRRSSPYSIQEMKHAFGVAAARDCILQRFNLATQASGISIGVQHLKLVTDLMVHSGEVHGLTSHGYRDLMRSLKTAAPFTAGAFRAPIKNFMEAGERGDEEVLRGVLASCVFGKRVPLGTGADFCLKVNTSESLTYSEGRTKSVDVHECLSDLIAKIGVERPETPPHSEVEFGDVANDSWMQSSSFKTGLEDAGDWGSHDKSASVQGVNSGGWGSPEKNASINAVHAGGWGCVGEEASNKGVGGWGSPDKNTSTKGANLGGWGSPDKNASTKGASSGGWASPDKNASTKGASSGGWDSPDKNASTKGASSGGWGSPDKNASNKGASSGGWGSPDKNASTKVASSGGWASPDKNASTGGVDPGGLEGHVGGWCSPRSSPDKNASNKGASSGGWVSPDKNASTKVARSGGWASPDKNASTGGVDTGGSEKHVGGWCSPTKGVAARGTNSGGWGDGESCWGSRSKSVQTKVVRSHACEASVNTTAGNSVRGSGNTPERKVDAAGVGDERKFTPGTVRGSRWGTKDAELAETVKSGGWGGAGTEDAGAWVVESDTQGSAGGGWGWESIPEGSEVLCSPKGGASNWTDDSDGGATHSSWDNLPSVQTGGSGEKIFENDLGRGSAAVDRNGFSSCSLSSRSDFARSQTASVRQTKEVDGSRGNGGRQFRPTGANTTPLGKVRVFKNLVIELPVLESLSPPHEFAVLTEDVGKQNLLVRGDPNLPVTGIEEDHHLYLQTGGRSGFSSQPWGTCGSEPMEKNHDEVELELAGNSSGEVQDAALWMSSEDRASKDADSGWSFRTVDSQTIASDPSRLGAAAGDRTIGNNVVWSPGSRRKDWNDPRNQDIGKEPQTSGGWLHKRDQNWNWKRPETKREVDHRKESEEWKELEALVWSIRNILKKYEPEARLGEEDHSLLLTRVLPKHPSSAAKVGCGIDYIKVAKHMDTRCFFLVRKDGTAEDFSYHKCLLTLASEKSPSLADLYKSLYMSRRKTEPRALVEAIVRTDTRMAETPVGADVQAEISGTENGAEVQSRILGCAEAEWPVAGSLDGR